MDNELENADSQNGTEDTDELNLDLSDDNESGVDEVEALKKENATLKAQKEHWKKKATEVKDEKPAAPETSNRKEDEVAITPKDTLALTEAKVSVEDYDEVVRVAKILGKPIIEALKDNTLKSILRERVEERLTANATQVKSPRSSSKPVGEVLLDRAYKGELPEKDEDITALAEAQMARRIQDAKS